MRRLTAVLPVILSVSAALSVPAAVAQVATAAATYDAANGKLTAAEVKAAFGGKHEEDGVDITGHAWTIRVAADGRANIVAGSFVDTGRIVLRADTVCVSWARSWQGQEKCFHYAHHNQQFASYGPDGALNSTLTISR